MHLNKKTLVVAVIILVAALARLIPHPLNFAPLGAMALFGSAYFGRKGLGLFITMAAWMVSDLILNNLVYSTTQGFVLFTEGAFYIYLPLALIYGVGSLLLSKVTVARVLAGSVLASVLFFALSNFGVWMTGLMYPMSAEGLLACYAAALPFFKNTLAGDLFFSVVLFVAYERYLKTLLITQRANR